METVPSSVDGIESIYASAAVGPYPRSSSIAVRWSRRWRPGISGSSCWAGICALAAAALSGAMLLVMRQAQRLNEEQIHRAAAEKTALEGQRLEILGQLAAGVANDSGNVAPDVEVGAMMIEKKAADEPTVPYRPVDRRGGQARAVADAADAGFCRDSGPDGDRADGVVHPAEAVSAMSRLLSSTLGAGCQVRYLEEAEGLPALVRGDRGGLEGRS